MAATSATAISTSFQLLPRSSTQSTILSALSNSSSAPYGSIKNTLADKILPSAQIIAPYYMKITLFAEGKLPPNGFQMGQKSVNYDKSRLKHHSVQFHAEAKLSRRQLCSVTSLLTILTINDSILSKPVKAEDKANDEQKDNGIIGSFKSLFDPNEKTKSGKVLPKAYLKSAREVVKTLRESLEEDPNDMAKFRRTADAAKESIRDYLSNWKGQQSVIKEESYEVLEKAFRSLAKFYSKAGPSASLSGDVKSEILHDLDTAEQFL
ncbi:hypothetical protein RND81_11G173100 [Saponaria officinalis]|uniref:Uncharacterized protein n=1 Tax=Saponaria officinalis TaxID=3572 RepID=A0AAW1HNC7_SAPOF